MSNDKVKVQGLKPPAAEAPETKTPPPGITKVAPLFRRVDWLTLLITFLGVWIGYYLTLAPELTLEDSGELAVGSMYAGIPHPPGYPVWTIYTWLWTVLLPFKNIAWRVALAEATSGALAAGLLGLIVSRGSSMLIEGIEELKGMAGRWENAICVISGFVAGQLIGYNGYMWSQSVIVEVYSFSVCSFSFVLVFLMRWIHAPHQYRYLYLAMFMFGITFTNHQSLIVAAMGIEVAIAAAHFRLGRWLFLGNSICYVAGLLLKQQGILTTLDANEAILRIFHVVGIGSILAYVWFTILTKETFKEFCFDAAFSGFFLLLAGSIGNSKVVVLLALVALGLAIKMGWETRKFGHGWLVMINSGICWLFGSAFYFYMPLAGMSNPPMQWGYPRTVEGFIHAFTRGQYEKMNPTNFIEDPGRFMTQLSMLVGGIFEEFNVVYAFLAIVPFLFFFKLHKRERAWLIGVLAIYLCLGVLLLILLNPPPDRAARDLVRVFFGASHMMIALLVGYGLTLVATYMATHYQRFRFVGLVGGAVAIALALFTFVSHTTEVYFGEGANVPLGDIMSLTVSAFTDKYQYGLPVFAGLILIGMAVTYVISLLVYRNRAPLFITLAIFAAMPLYPVMTHWSNNEQREHWFGYWFGHDMFTPPFNGKDNKPLYPEMTKDAILYGGTDPGRFCPTYMIFADSLTDPKYLPERDQKFDRRDVYIITQNALADGTYLNYIRAHYNRSKQIDPPFFQEFVRSSKERELNYTTNFLSRLMVPVDRYFTDLGDRIEKDRRTFTSWFKPDDFRDLKTFGEKLKPSPDQSSLSKFIYDSLSTQTRQLLAASGQDTALRKSLCEDLNKLLDRELQTKAAMREKREEKARLEQYLATSNSESKRRRVTELEKELGDLTAIQPLYVPARFQNVKISEYLQDFIKENPQSHTRVRLNRLLLEAAYPDLITKTKGGVYPDREMYIATPDDSQRCFQEYLADAQRRLQLNQLKPGEDVKVIDNRVQVSGQVAVMAINGLLTKVMFDANPKNEFYVEESFPLDWMYPHLTPFGVIMKINRQQLPELTQDIVDTDHQFWSTYSERLIGNWITYDTSVKEISEFVERVYLRRNFKGFTGDRKFVRDDQAQKAFSKLRSSIGGVYNWRIANAKSPAEQQRMIKEADFAFKQAFAFCPYSPEAVFRYVNLLLMLQRYQDAYYVASTCLKLDPYNAQVVGLVDNLRRMKDQPAPANVSLPLQQDVPQLEKAVQANPADFQSAFNLAALLAQRQQVPRAIEIISNIVHHPKADAPAYRAAVQAYASIGQRQQIQALADYLQGQLTADSNKFDAALGLAEASKALQMNDRAAVALDGILTNPKADANAVLQVAQLYASMANYPRLEATLDKLVLVAPNSPEAWYDLAAMKASLNKNSECLQALGKAITLSDERIKVDTNARNLVLEAQKDDRFKALRDLPEFKKLARL